MVNVETTVKCLTAKNSIESCIFHVSEDKYNVRLFMGQGHRLIKNEVG